MVVYVDTPVEGPVGEDPEAEIVDDDFDAEIAEDDPLGGLPPPCVRLEWSHRSTRISYSCQNALGVVVIQNSALGA